MENNLPLHLKMFNDRVKVMNQSNSKQLILSAQEARNVQADIFDILNYCAGLNIKSKSIGADVVSINMDGGQF